MRAQGTGRAAMAALGVLGAATVLAGCSTGGSGTNAVTGSAKYRQTNLVSDIPALATITDANLVNPWGIAYSPTGPFWIADNNSGKSTLYDGAGAPQSLVVSIPSPTAGTPGTSDGQVYNGTSGFKLSNGSPALFIFSTEDGTIVGWNGASGSSAEIAADRSSIPAAGSGAVYKGLAIGTVVSATPPAVPANYLYAANFRSGKIDVYDSNFSLVTLPGTFTDPGLPAGFAPFGIQNIGGLIYVSYAMQNAAKHDDVAGAGSGLINVFDTSGNFKRRLVTGTAVGGSTASLNSPWGMALAPNNFGAFSGALLVGNFGDGRISGFNPTSGAFLGLMQNTAGTPVTIPGLWGLSFGNGGSAGPTNTLFFTAGIGDAPTFTTNREKHGLFGSLQPAP